MSTYRDNVRFFLRECGFQHSFEPHILQEVWVHRNPQIPPVFLDDLLRRNKGDISTVVLGIECVEKHLIPEEEFPNIFKKTRDQIEHIAYWYGEETRTEPTNEP